MALLTSHMGRKFGRVLRKSEETAAVRAAQRMPPRSTKMEIGLGRMEGVNQQRREEVLKRNKSLWKRAKYLYALPL
jgi:hypothetical protein